jgi:hypothetical protein
MNDKVVPIKGVKLTPLVLQHGEHMNGQVTLDFNRPLTPEEFEFFFETSIRTAYLMQGIELK